MVRARRPMVAWVLTLVLLALSGVVTVAFQDKGFVPVKPGETGQETLPATPLVFVAYAFVWVALLGYVVLLWRRLGRVERELADVRAKLRASEAKPL
jgi:CcmD family protein